MESRRATWANATSHLQVVQVIPEKPPEALAPCLVGRDGRPLVRNGLVDGQDLEDRFPEEEEDLLQEEDEAEMSLLPQNVSLLPSVCVQAFAPVSVPLSQELVSMIESLRNKLLAERRRNLVQEMEIRKEMGDAMLQQLMESEEQRRSFFCTSDVSAAVCLQ